MIPKQTILAAAMAALSFPALAADGIVVGYKDVVEPEPQLVAFTQEIVQAWISIKRVDPSRRDKFFAPTVKTFMKNETPLQPFEPRDDITSDYLRNAVFTFRVKKGSIPDEDIDKYTLGAMSDIGRQIRRNPVWGTLPEVPGMVCAAAAFDVDIQAVAKFSRMHGVRIDKLVFYKEPVALYAGKTHKSEFVGNVPPYALIAVGKDDVATEDWHPLIASTGIKGYVGDPVEPVSLVQKHVCFTKVDSEYRIGALFGYGL